MLQWQPQSHRGLIREGFPEEVNMHGRKFERRGDREGRSSLGRDEKRRNWSFFCRLNTFKGEQAQKVGEMKRALSAHEGREENQAFPSSCTGWGPSLRHAEMTAQITCLVRRQQERSHRT